MKLLLMSRAPVLWNYSESFHYCEYAAEIRDNLWLYLVDGREFGRNNLNIHSPLR